MRLPFFPEAEEDEILYSLIARFAQRMPSAMAHSIHQMLFGHKTTSIIDLPTRLQEFVQRVAPTVRLDVDQLIDRHTLFPYFAAFQSPAQVSQARAAMLESGSPHGRLGLMSMKHPPIEHLRYCPCCVKQGDVFWKRLHQIPSIQVCPEHHVFLLQTVPYIRRISRQDYIALEDVASQDPKPRVIDHNSHLERCLLEIAIDSAWVLKSRPSISDLTDLQKKYFKLALLKNLATYSGQFHAEELTKQFMAFYPIQLLEHELGIELSNLGWVVKLLRHPRNAAHPVKHFLLMRFLGVSAEEFFQLDSQIFPFGKAPYPCLNPVCSEYQKSVIQNYELRYTLSHGKPVARFRCQCGFCYERTGPDSTPTDRLRYDLIPAYGQIWQNELKRLWLEPTFSLRGLAKHLGVDPITLRRQAQKLGLTSQRPASRVAQKATNKSKITKNLYNNIDHRIVWLETRAQFPNLGNRDLRQLNNQTYMWLYRNDLEWLKSESAPRVKVEQPQRIDWSSRDQAMLPQVVSALHEMQQSSLKPQRITLVVIIRRLKAPSWFARYLSRLPACQGILEDQLDTDESFALRRIDWAIKQYKQKNKVPNPSQVLRLANIRATMSRKETILQAIRKEFNHHLEVLNVAA